MYLLTILKYEKQKICLYVISYPVFQAAITRTSLSFACNGQLLHFEYTWSTFLATKNMACQAGVQTKNQ